MEKRVQLESQVKKKENCEKLPNPSSREPSGRDIGREKVMQKNGGVHYQRKSLHGSCGGTRAASIKLS